MDSRYPSFVPIAINEDLRGGHHKFFGSKPEAIAIDGFSIAEVFMTHSHKNVVRGISLQSPPQKKLITVLTGEIQGNAICCDPSLPEFGTPFAFRLVAGTGKKLYLPPLWAQGYRTLEEDTRVLYMAGADFSPEGVGMNPLDPALGLYWGDGFTADDAVMAERDRNLPFFSEVVEQIRAVAADWAARERNEA